MELKDALDPWQYPKGTLSYLLIHKAVFIHPSVGEELRHIIPDGVGEYDCHSRV